MTSPVKVRKTLTLDPDLVEAFGGEGAVLSARVNQALREVKDAAEQRESFALFVASLVQAHGLPSDEELSEAQSVVSEAMADAEALRERLGLTATSASAAPGLGVDDGTHPDGHSLEDVRAWAAKHLDPHVERTRSSGALTDETRLSAGPGNRA